MSTATRFTRAVRKPLTAPATLLDRTTPVPLHHQVSEALRADIAAGRYLPGDLLPPETTLAAELGLSRATVRQAIGRLVAEGLLTRRRGVGTAVARPDLEQPLTRLYSFAQLAEGTGQQLTTSVLSRRVSPAGAVAAEQLGLREREDRVVEVERLRCLDGTPLVLEQIVLPASLWPEAIEGIDLTRPLYELLERDRGVVVTTARERLRPVNLGAREARLLEQPAGAAAFHVERTGLAAERPVEWRRSLIRGDRYLYSVELVRGNGAPAAIAMNHTA